MGISICYKATMMDSKATQIRIPAPPISMRDPLHGSIPISFEERALIDTPEFQRLRNIRQLGFADLAFPSATHNRMCHSIGAMHLASRIFDTLFAGHNFPANVKHFFRQTTRLAMLFHDIGHAPFSHTTEKAMPKLGSLNLSKELLDGRDLDAQANHEDYTLLFLTGSPLSAKIEHWVGKIGITGNLLAQIINGTNNNILTHEGMDYTPVIRQIISSEIDADRMDYLERDSFFCGVNYGRFDRDWLIDNLIAVPKDGAYWLGLRSKAIFGFEDFLLSRYHMFATIYHHYTPSIFEKFLEKYLKEAPGEFLLPSDIEAYSELDDVSLLSTLRQSNNAWAKRITRRKAYYLLMEQDSKYPSTQNDIDIDTLCAKLRAADVQFFESKATSNLSKYFGARGPSLYVQTPGGQIHLLEEYTPLFKRYQRPSAKHRIYVRPKQKQTAQAILDALMPEAS